MYTADRIKEICKNRKLSISSLEKSLKFSNGYISKLRDDNITADRLKAIADFFNVTTDFLITGEDTTTAPRLTIDEEHLLKNYRKASDKGRGRIQEYAREMVQLYQALPDDLEGILTVLEQKKIQKADTIKPVVDDNIVGYAIAGTGLRKPITDVAKKVDTTHTEQ